MIARKSQRLADKKHRAVAKMSRSLYTLQPTQNTTRGTGEHPQREHALQQTTELNTPPTLTSRSGAIGKTKATCYICSCADGGHDRIDLSPGYASTRVSPWLQTTTHIGRLTYVRARLSDNFAHIRRLRMNTRTLLHREAGLRSMSPLGQPRHSRDFQWRLLCPQSRPSRCGQQTSLRANHDQMQGDDQALCDAIIFVGCGSRDA
jgi:hypothetical protein